MDGTQDSFTVLKLVRSGDSAEITIEDGNDRVLASQSVEYTDFPMPKIQLYAVWEADHWIAMLPSEY